MIIRVTKKDFLKIKATQTQSVSHISLCINLHLSTNVPSGLRMMVQILVALPSYACCRHWQSELVDERFFILSVYLSIYVTTLHIIKPFKNNVPL